MRTRKVLIGSCVKVGNDEKRGKTSFFKINSLKSTEDDKYVLAWKHRGEQISPSIWQ